MPSIISSFYDALAVECVATWPSAAHISDALSLETAPDIMLNNGFAIAIGPGIGGTDQSCQEMFVRDVLIFRVMRVAATENDQAKMASSVKSLMEAIFDLRKNIRLNNTLGGVVSDIGFISDGGIELLPTASGKFHVLSSVYSVKYLENLY